MQVTLHGEDAQLYRMVGRIQAHDVSEGEVVQKQTAAIMKRGGIDGGRWRCKADRHIPPTT